MKKYRTTIIYGKIDARYMFYTFFLITIVFGNSCKKFIQVDPPINQIVASTVFTDNNTANAAQTAIYSQISNSGAMPYFIPLLTGLSGDELTSYSNYQDLNRFYLNSLNSANGLVPYLWTPAYNYIFQANAVLEGLQNSVGVSGPVKQQITGEAKFTRAFWSFYLVNLFGDVPLVISTDYKTNVSASRSSKEQVYQQIIADLKDAQNLLNSNYVGADGITTTSERVRPNKWAATALLARVYLYRGDWKNAETLATSVINNSGLYHLETDLNNVFIKNSSEAIWQLAVPLPSSYNTIEGKYFILISAPQTNVFNCSTISSQLLNAFELGDNRKISWIGSFTAGTSTYKFPNKYKVYSNSSITEYSMVLRLAELYLIRAEAEANGAGGGINSAVNDLNVIRSRAGLINYSGAVEKAFILSAIIHERQVELFTEWGHRWLDLKRTGNINNVLNIVAPTKGGAWNDNSQLYPIPVTEILNDPKLTQNPGY